MEPLKSWRCDECGEPVSVAEGYVIWNRRDELVAEYRVIHKGRCDRKEYTSSLPLSDFLGPDGLVKLTSMLSYGLMDAASGGLSRSEVPDYPLPNLDAWVDFVRRVQVPHYEQARHLFSEVETQEELAGSSEVSPYLQSTLTRLVAPKA